MLTQSLLLQVHDGGQVDDMREERILLINANRTKSCYYNVLLVC